MDVSSDAKVKSTQNQGCLEIYEQGSIKYGISGHNIAIGTLNEMSMSLAASTKKFATRISGLIDSSSTIAFRCRYVCPIRIKKVFRVHSICKAFLCVPASHPKEVCIVLCTRGSWTHAVGSGDEGIIVGPFLLPSERREFDSVASVRQESYPSQLENRSYNDVS
jgi:hypothetical protein